MLLGTPSSIITMGYGTPGSGALVITLGFGAGTAARVLRGPVRVAAIGSYLPGAKALGTYQPSVVCQADPQ